MRFTGITFSGPDDSTPIGVLLELQRNYPHMEVGVLWSPKRAGTPRYVGREWIEKASELGLNFSLHLCGKVARQLVEDGETPEIPGRPKRVQINCNGMKPTPGWYRRLDSIRPRHDGRPQFIIQTCNHSGAYWVGLAQGDDYDAVPLFDKSGGTGLLPDSWPYPLPFTHCGYAGGIGADNVVEVVEHLKTGDGESFWIDMESKIRTDDAFNLDKIAHVLILVDGLIVSPLLATGR